MPGITEQLNDLRRAIDIWCPPGFNHEGNDVRMLRAFMNMRACVKDLRLQLAGKPVIRPLNTYPKDP